MASALTATPMARPGGGLNYKKYFLIMSACLPLIRNILLFLQEISFFIPSVPIFEVASDAPVSHWTKFIAIVQINAPMAEEMRFQKLIKSVMLII